MLEICDVNENLLSIFEFYKRFPTEEDCYNYLFKIRWPSGFVCPKCGCVKFSFLKKQKRFQCSGCRHQTSITSGTLFHGVHLNLLTIFTAIYLIATSKKGISALELQRKLGIKSYKTSWLLMHKIRIAMSSPDMNDAIDFNDEDNLFNNPIIMKNMKVWLLGTYNHIPEKYKIEYQNEFTFRFKHRLDLNNIFEKLLHCCICLPFYFKQAEQ